MEALRKRDDAVSVLRELGVEATSLLRQALDLFASLDQAGPDHDPGTVQQPSIAPHDQNHHHHGWTWLIELCRDAFNALLHTDRTRAATLANEWSVIPYPTFRRLSVYACGRLMEKRA